MQSRLPANAVLQERIAPLLKRPVGRPPKSVRRLYASCHYRAQTWDFVDDLKRQFPPGGGDEVSIG